MLFGFDNNTGTYRPEPHCDAKMSNAQNIARIQALNRHTVLQTLHACSLKSRANMKTHQTNKFARMNSEEVERHRSG